MKGLGVLLETNMEASDEDYLEAAFQIISDMWTMVAAAYDELLAKIPEDSREETKKKLHTDRTLSRLEQAIDEQTLRIPDAEYEWQRKDALAKVREAAEAYVKIAYKTLGGQWDGVWIQGD